MTPAITWFLLGLLRIVACEVQNDFFFEYGSKIFEIGRDMAENIAGMAFSGASGTSAEKPVMYRNRVDRNITVQTSYGVVKGRAAVTMRRRKEYLAFLGMPYAAPPLGDLRFKAPVEPESWEGIRDATFERRTCLSFMPNKEKSLTDEDCLYLNVFTPSTSEGEKPVMAFIHGGAFIGGSSSTYLYSPDFFMDQDVVLVTFNYRLGPLGFISLQNAEVPGNAGLKDQMMALKWIKKNIAKFGGDSKSVTIFGESAGAASVHFHVLSRQSAGLFHRAIMQSGNALAPWAYRRPDDALRQAFGLGEVVGCSTRDVDELLKCLKETSSADLVAKQERGLSIMEILSLNPIAFTPTSEPKFENSFVDEDPTESLTIGNFNRVPMIIGSNSAEGLLLLPPFKKYDPFGLVLIYAGQNLGQFLPHFIKEKCSPDEESEVVAAVKEQYLENQQLTVMTRRKILDYLTDVAFLIPTQRSATLMALHSVPVYNYLFSYDGPYGLYKAETGIDDEAGVAHADELGYLFCPTSLHPEYAGHENIRSPQEITVDRMIGFWTNFAKTGKPTAENEDPAPPAWEPYNSDGYNYMEIGEALSSGGYLGRERVHFWAQLYQMVSGNKSKSFPE